MATLKLKTSKGASKSVVYTIKNGRDMAISGNMLNTDDREYLTAEVERHLALHDVGQNENSRAQIQAYGFVLGFGHDEFPKDSDPEKVNQAGYEYFKSVYEDVPFVVVTHNDGAGEKWHNHVIVLNADTNGKALRGERSNLMNQRKVMNDYFLENKKDFPMVDVLTEDRLNEKYNDKKHKSLKMRASIALNKSTNVEEFKKNLENEDIELIVRNSRSKKADKKKDIVGMKFKDKKNDITARSSKLSDNFHYKNILQKLEENKEKQKENKKKRHFDGLFSEKPAATTTNTKIPVVKKNEEIFPTIEHSERSGSIPNGYDTTVEIPKLFVEPETKPKSKPPTKPKETTPNKEVSGSLAFVQPDELDLVSKLLKKNEERNSRAVSESSQTQRNRHKSSDLNPF